MKRKKAWCGDSYIRRRSEETNHGTVPQQSAPHRLSPASLCASDFNESLTRSKGNGTIDRAVETLLVGAGEQIFQGSRRSPSPTEYDWLRWPKLFDEIAQ
jgi:hypothetical protein